VVVAAVLAELIHLDAVAIIHQLLNQAKCQLRVAPPALGIESATQSVPFHYDRDWNLQ
jgi:hypothetical protein